MNYFLLFVLILNLSLVITFLISGENPNEIFPPAIGFILGIFALYIYYTSPTVQ